MSKSTMPQQRVLAVLGIAVFVLCLVIVQPFLSPLIGATAIAILFHPVHLRLSRRFRNPELAAAISLTLVAAVVIAPTAILVTVLAGEATDLVHNVTTKTTTDGWMIWMNERIHRILSGIGVPASAEQQVRQVIFEKLQALSGSLLNGARAVATDLASSIATFVVMLFTLFFLFRDGHKLRRKLVSMTPLSPPITDRLLTDVGQSVVANFYGIAAVALAQGSLTGLIFWILGLPSPVLWGSVAGLFSTVPIVGATVVWIPTAIILAATGAWVKAAILAGFGAGVIGLADNLVRPYVISGKVDMHPLLVFFSLLGGVQAFGFLGLFIGPAAVTLLIAIVDLLREEQPSAE